MGSLAQQKKDEEWELRGTAALLEIVQEQFLSNFRAPSAAIFIFSSTFFISRVTKAEKVDDFASKWILPGHVNNSL